MKLPTFSPPARVSLGLVLLTVSILLIGDMFGLIPKSNHAMLASREKIAESLAIQISAAAYAGEMKTLQATLNGIVKRNDDILSVALRRFNGRLVAQAGNHQQRWLNSSDDAVTTHVKIDLYKDKSKWGQFELVFAPLGSISVKGLFESPLVRLLLFTALSGFVGYLIFIKKTLRELDPSKVVPAHVKATLDALAEGVIILDESERIVLTNSRFADRIKVSSAGLLGRKASSLNWKLSQSNDVQPKFPWVVATELKEHQKGIPMNFETREGEQIAFMVNSSPIMDAKGNIRGAMATFDDVTQLEQKNSELAKALQMLRESRDEVQQQNVELEVLATRDPLTNCLNRRAFFENMEIAFARAKESGQELSAIMIDIDHFKSINDTYGHARGDEIIKQVAELMSSSLRSNDIVGRYGGEEFCIYLEGMGANQAAGLADRIRQRIENNDAEAKITCSLGVSSLRSGAASAPDLVNQADEALYLAKKTGRNRVIRYDKKAEIENWLALQQVEEAHKETEVGGVQVSEQTVLYSKLKNELEFAQKHDSIVAVLMINLDRFKGIVHTLGQNTSEKLLNIIEQRLREAMRRRDVIQHLNNKPSADSVERISREEYMVILTNLHSEDEISSIARRLMELVAKPVSIAKHDVLVTCSIGVSIFPEHSSQVEDLINKAAMALGEASRQGRNHLQFYNDVIQTAATAAVRIESKLSQAIERNEFHLVYQPRIDLQSGRITSLEALLRWEHPELGPVSPDMFIPLAEDSGIIIEVGEWVLREACRQVTEWRKDGLGDIRVSVNMSTKQLLDVALDSKIKQILEDTNAQSDWLELEITETAIMENLDMTKAMLVTLKDMGIHLSIDDFGTGYSSLGYLKYFHVDALKIDRSFVLDLAHDKHDQMLVSTISEMASRFGLTLVAEGVETYEQLDQLYKYNCDEIQGYIFSIPLLPTEAATLLKTNLLEPCVPTAGSDSPVPIASQKIGKS
jgi:diguanylate cyclase (GGDEF)-like protein/PAS domain S-box-containing protein